MQIETPELNEGEIYVGAVVNSDGTGHHIILLPGDNDNATWQAQMDWANNIGGDLPDRVESALLFQKFKDQFKECGYWTNEAHASDAGYAWYQFFIYGYQINWRKGYYNRARAVRRVQF